MFKTTAALAAAVAVVAVSGYATAPDFCPPTEFAKFAPVLATNGADLLACQTASNWTFIPPNAEPTVSQELVMCNVPQCKKLLDATAARGPSDCFLSLTNNASLGINVLKIVEEFPVFCQLFGNLNTIST